MHGRIPFIAFGMTHCGKSLLWAGTDALSLFVLIKIVQLPPLWAGILFVLSSFWNAIGDGLWGRTLERTPMIRAALPGLCALASILACLSFAILPWLTAGSAIMATIALVLFRTTFSLLDVPHNATAAALANMHGHLVVARLRAILGSASSIVVAAAVLPMLGQSPVAVTAARTMFVAIAMIACILLAPLPWLVRTARQGDITLPQGGTVAFGKRPRRALAAFCFVQMLGFAALASMGKAVLHADALHSWLLDYALLLLSVLRLAAIGFWSPLATRIGSPAALSCAYAANAVAVLALPIAIGQGTVSTIVVLSALGMSIGGVGLLAWSAFSELLSRLGLEGNQAMAARSYGWFTAMSKIGLGFSGLLTGAWLSQQAGALTEQSLWPLVVLVAALCLISALMGWPGWNGGAKWMFGRFWRA
ncbi:MFS transporter [Sphingobium aquiterrae]|uniref:MFS transporter n=1 Tax=Sphingobium aquiterrae TaxID=2038656 RepID=UPI003017A3AC